MFFPPLIVRVFSPDYRRPNRTVFRAGCPAKSPGALRNLKDEPLLEGAYRLELLMEVAEERSKFFLAVLPITGGDDHMFRKYPKSYSVELRDALPAFRSRSS